MYAKGMTTRDIQERILEICGAEISPSATSHITERVTAIAQELQSRPLDTVYVGRAVKGSIDKPFESSFASFCLSVKQRGLSRAIGWFFMD